MNELRRARETLLDVLQSCSLFAQLPANDLAAVADRMNLTHTKRGRLIMQDGDLTNDIYFLISGGVIGQLIADTGREILFTEVTAGGYFGELAALDGSARSITISASSDCVLAKLTGADFRDILLRYPQIGINLATDLAARLRQMNERVFGLVVHNVETRVSFHLMRLAQAQEQLIDGGIVEGAPTRESIANFVGSNREAVSRTFARLRAAGIIATKHKFIQILDLNRLLAAAEGETP